LGRRFPFRQQKQKTRWRLAPAGFFNPAVDSGRSAQAIAVRRHVRPMMVVVTMMEVEVHLKINPKQAGRVCQIFRCEFFPRGWDDPIRFGAE
jgi:hypothetical protein